MSGRPLALLGFMGAGKTSVGEAVAVALGWRFLDLDRQVELALGKAVAMIFEEQGEDAFRAAEARVLPSLVGPEVVIALGGGAAANDATWRLLAERTLTIWLDAPAEVLWERVGSGSGRPLAQSFEQFAALLARRGPLYARAARRVDAARPLPQVVSEVIELCAA